MTSEQMIEAALPKKGTLAWLLSRGVSLPQRKATAVQVILIAMKHLPPASRRSVLAQVRRIQRSSCKKSPASGAADGEVGNAD